MRIFHSSQFCIKKCSQYIQNLTYLSKEGEDDVASHDCSKLLHISNQSNLVFLRRFRDCLTLLARRRLFTYISIFNTKLAQTCRNFTWCKSFLDCTNMGETLFELFPFKRKKEISLAMWRKDAISYLHPEIL